MVDRCCRVLLLTGLVLVDRSAVLGADADTDSAVGPPFRVTLKEGGVGRTQFQADLTLSGGLELNRVHSLTAPASSVDFSAGEPMHLVTLWTGERLMARVINSQPGQETPSAQQRTSRLLVIRPCGARLQVPESAVESIRLPERTCLPAWSGNPAQSSFWTREPNGVFSRRLLPPVAPVCVQMIVDRDAVVRGSIGFVFESVDGSADSLTVSLQKSRVAADFNGRQRQSGRPRRIELRVVVDDGLRLTLNGRSLLRDTRSPGRLASIEFRREPPAGTSGEASSPETEILPTCLVLGRCDSVRPFEHNLNQYSVATAAGTIYGTGIQIAASGLRLKTPLRELRLSWPESRAIRLPRCDAPKPRAIQGQLVDIEFQPERTAMLFARPTPTRIRAALKAVSSKGITMDHALLRSPESSFQIPWSRIYRIRPLFDGSLTLIDAGPRHLGNGIRSEFAVPRPDGTELEYALQVDERPGGPVWLSADISEMEAAAPDAPAASPRLSELRDGFLITECLINGKKIGNWNQLVSFRRAANDPQRLRLRIPEEALLVGRNLLVIRQQPARDDKRSFDDLLIRNLALEMESP